MQLSIKYRPTRFGEVVGQPTSVRILVNSILLGRTPKAVLFRGLHGIGKTTLARLYAKALNCENFLHTQEICNSCINCTSFSNNPYIIEMDAASNNGVDDVRSLQERLRNVSDIPYKVVILDECHMLSTQAQAAFLKLLEEADSSKVFLLVTTNSDKLQSTVRSRCLSMPLKPLTGSEIASSLSGILKAEGIPYSQEFVNALSTQCGGSLRDTLQILDQIITNSGGSTLDIDILSHSLGLVTPEQYANVANILSWIGRYDADSMQKSAIEQVVAWDQAGVDLQQLFLEGLPKLIRDISVYLNGAAVPSLSGIDLRFLDFKLTFDDIKRFLRRWEQLEDMAKREPRLAWELYFISIL